MSRQEYPVAPPSRQTSNTSSTMSGSVTASGSENWETYTDNSEAEEADATDAYYAKVKAQQLRQHQQAHYGTMKRPGTATTQLGASKRFRDQIITEEDAAHGSEVGWVEEEGDVGETY